MRSIRATSCARCSAATEHGAAATRSGARRRGRWRFVALLTASSTRSAADAGLRLFVVLLATAGAPAERESAWHLVTALFMLPCVMLAPLNGALGNSLPKRNVLVGAAAYILLATVLFGWHGGAWTAGVVVIALGRALYTPTRFAMLPAAAADTGWPLLRVAAWIEGGAVLSMAAGMVLAGVLATATPIAGVPATVWALGLLSLVCLLASWPTRFESDLRRPEPAAVAVRGFVADLRRVVADRSALAPLLGLATLRGLAAAAVGALIAAVLDRQGGQGPEAAYRTLLAVALLTMAGAGVGSMLAGLLRDPRRALVLVPFGATGMAIALAGAALAPTVPPALCATVGLLGGLVNVPLLVAYQNAVPADARGNAMAVLNTAGYLGITALALAMAALSASGTLSASGQLLSVAALSGVAAAAAWKWLRPRSRVRQPEPPAGELDRSETAG